MKAEDFILRPLTADDARELASLLQRQAADYARFFTPFDFAENSITAILRRQIEDLYMGLFWDRKLVGLFMLRGWDEGYSSPAFGILIDEPFRGLDLEMISLEAARTICRLRGAPGMMTKVHPDNMSAKGVLRKIGFTLSGSEPQTGRLIYRSELTPRNSSENKTASRQPGLAETHE